MQLINESPYIAERFINMDKDGAEVLVLLVKATFELPNESKTALTNAEQTPIEFADIYIGEPGTSSLKYEADVGMCKQATDVVLIGHAYAEKYGDSFVDVSFRLGDINKTARVFGDRQWENRLGVASISPPMPFTKIPLTYERAFGGSDTSHTDPKLHDCEQKNPVGAGFRAKHSRLPVEGLKLPNIEHPKSLIRTIDDRPDPVGFGFVAKNWLPRVNFQGTYNDKWMKTRMPLLPENFDDRFNNAASTGLVSKSFLKGGEKIEIRNASQGGYLGFSLPQVTLLGDTMIVANVTPIDMNLDTVIIDTDLNRLILLWRGMQNIHKVVEDVRWVRVSLEGQSNVFG